VKKEKTAIAQVGKKNKKTQKSTGGLRGHGSRSGWGEVPLRENVEWEVVRDKKRQHFQKKNNENTDKNMAD